jgi:hypothetical protein
MTEWLVLVLLALTQLAPAHPVLAADPPRAELPTYEVGRRWIRNDGTYELVTVDADGYLFKGSGRRQSVRLTKSLGIAQIQSGPYLHTFVPPLTLDWPLEVGKKGGFRGMMGQTATTFSWVVARFGDVRVGPSVLQAFEIRVEVTHPPFATGGRITLWYAPERREFVKLNAYHQGIVEYSAANDPADVQLSRLNFEVVGVDPRSPQARPPAPPAAPSPPPQAAVSPAPTLPPPAGPASRDAAAPRITISIPQDLAQVSEESVPLAGVVTGQDITQVIVALNGVELTRIADARPQSVVPLNVPLRLAPGRNHLVVTAITAAGAVQQDIRSVIRQQGKAISITYRVKATSNLIRVTYRTPEGRSERRELRLPLDVVWSLSFDTAEGSQLEIGVELADDQPGAVTCEILVDGSVVSAESREGRRLGTRCMVPPRR